MKNRIFSNLSSINRLQIPLINEPVNIKIYWFQAHSYAQNPFSSFFKPHVHSFHEIHFIFQGNLTYKVEGKDIVGSKGQYIMIPAKMNHTQVSCSDDLIRISLSFDILTAEDNRLSRIMYTPRRTVRP